MWKCNGIKIQIRIHNVFGPIVQIWTENSSLVERIQCYPQGAEFLANLLIHRHRSTPHYASSFIISLTYKLFRYRYAEFHCILCLLVNDFQGQWKKGVLGVQLPTLLADTDTQPLPFLTVLLLHGFLSNSFDFLSYKVFSWKIWSFAILDKQKSHSKFK